MSEPGPTHVRWPSSLAELRAVNPTNPAWLVDLVQPEINGGRVVPADLDAISGQPEATALRVSGLDQSTFETLVEHHGRQFTALILWKCPRIQDFTPLESLPDLTLVSIYWNQRASALWNLEMTHRLRGLEIDAFTRLHDLESLRGAVAIDELKFGDWIRNRAVVASLEPLTAAKTLRRLSFTVRKIEDGRIQPLAELPLLDQLDFPSKLFTTEQIAWLRAHTPNEVESPVLAPTLRFGREVLVMGKRKPFLDARTDTIRIQRYVDSFWRSVARYRDDPTLEPPPEQPLRSSPGDVIER